jgi:hypothetical protein
LLLAIHRNFHKFRYVSSVAPVAEDVNLPSADPFDLAIRPRMAGICCWRFTGTFTSSATFNLNRYDLSEPRRSIRDIGSVTLSNPGIIDKIVASCLRIGDLWAIFAVLLSFAF